MDDKKKEGRYRRIYTQLKEILQKTDNRNARMSTIIAVLHHKMDYFFWTGFYFFQDSKLIVGQYQGPVACQELIKDTGVCWESINSEKTVIVDNVEKFPGHIACDSRTKSEIVIPVRDENNEIFAVLDIDSEKIFSNLLFEFY
jgi:L-methionine (R)-S-oxide reductase